MFLAALQSLYCVLWYMFLDIAAFQVIDCICKEVLRRCRSLMERRDVWLFESIILFSVSAPMYYYHHTPYVLCSLATVTMISALLTGSLSIQECVEGLKTYWREFKDHEESMEKTEAQQATTQEYRNHVSDDQKKDYLRQSERIIVSSSSQPPVGLGEGLTSLRYNEEKATYEYVGASEKHSSAPSAAAGLRRRALHSGVNYSNIVSSAEPPSSMMENIEGFGTKVWTALGLPRATSKLMCPPGLYNPGRNLCFLNSVLQCLSRSPNLADGLGEDAKSCMCDDASELAMLDASAETMQLLNVPPDENTLPVVDTANLREAASRLNPDILSDQQHYQQQQDACEFFTWLITQLHDTINESKGNGSKKKYNPNDSMATLTKVYGNLSDSHYDMMKTECRKQIANAEGFSDVNIAEPLQNLANLEWITYKRVNSSVIDDLFTTQMIEMQMCLQCSTVTASIQTCNIISLPISSGKPVALHDCLTAYGAQETLGGKEGLRCEKCQKFASLVKNTPARPTRLNQAQSDFNSLPVSPIQENSILDKPTPHDIFLASTPLPGTSSVSTPALRMSNQNEQILTSCVRQCLLRRLAECITIQLMRFQYNPFTKKCSKVKTPVIVPLDLDLSSILYDTSVVREDVTGICKENSYNLYGVSLHLGGENTSCGHYLAYCKATDGKWYKFDDEQVANVPNIKEEMQSKYMQENCYVLFYGRHHAAETDEPPSEVS